MLIHKVQAAFKKLFNTDGVNSKSKHSAHAKEKIRMVFKICLFGDIHGHSALGCFIAHHAKNTPAYVVMAQYLGFCQDCVSK